jgi:hypothetical protein
MIGLYHIVTSLKTVLRIEYTERGSLPHLARVYLRVYLFLMSRLNLSEIRRERASLFPRGSSISKVRQSPFPIPSRQRSGSFEGKLKELGALKDKNRPASSVFIVDFESRPDFKQPWPKTVDLVISCLARMVLGDIPSNLKFRDWMATQIDHPGICPLGFWSDIANDNRFAIAKIEHWGCAILPRPATLRGQEQHMPA